jgi:hypothetical protein
LKNISDFKKGDIVQIINIIERDSVYGIVKRYNLIWVKKGKSIIIGTNKHLIDTYFKKIEPPKRVISLNDPYGEEVWD